MTVISEFPTLLFVQHFCAHYREPWLTENGLEFGYLIFLGGPLLQPKSIPLKFADVRVAEN